MRSRTSPVTGTSWSTELPQATNVEIDLTARSWPRPPTKPGLRAAIRSRSGPLTAPSGAPGRSSTVAVDRAPVVTAQNKTLIHNQSVAASSLFTAADPDGNTITTYALKDVTGNGHFVVNGVTQATNVEIDLTAAQLAQTTYVAGSATDQLVCSRFRRYVLECLAGRNGNGSSQIKRRSSPR